MVVRYYSSVAPETTLSSTITAGAATILVGSTVGFPSLTPYTLAISYETATEELVQVNSAAGTSLSVTRGVDGTSATSHTAGARIRHVTSARDFSDSRSHENSDNGVHGLAPGEDLVGTDKVQTLSNKTLNMADGCLNRVDIFNNGGWTTSLNGDVAFPNTNLMSFKPDPSAATTLGIAPSGGTTMRNTVAVEGSINNYRFRITASDGTTDNFYILTGGTIFNRLQNGATGLRIQGSPDNVRRAALEVRDLNSTTTRSALYTDGTALVSSKAAALPAMDIRGASGQSVSIFRVANNVNTDLVTVDPLGQLSATGLSTSGSLAASSAVISSSFSGPGTVSWTQTTATGATVAAVSAGWSLAVASGVKAGGIAFVSFAVMRTGATITPDGTGNIPDTPMITLQPAWMPNASVGTSQLVAVGDGGASGTARLETTGVVNFVTWTPGVNITSGGGSNYRVTLSYPAA